MQDYLPGVEPLQVDNPQQGIEDPGDHDDDGKGDAEIAQQLVGLVLFCKRPNVGNKSRVSLTHFEG